MQPASRLDAPPGGIVCRVPQYPPATYSYSDCPTTAAARAMYALSLFQAHGIYVHPETVQVRPLIPIEVKIETGTHTPGGASRWTFELLLAGEAEPITFPLRGQWSMCSAKARTYAQLVATDKRREIECLRLVF